MKFDLVVIGGSAGSLQIILEILPKLKNPLNYSMVFVFHRKSTSTDQSLIHLLQSKSLTPIKEAEDKEPIITGQIYVAPANYHLLVEADYSFSLDASEKINYSRPSIDITFSTAADVYKSKTLAILLSGANSDGVDGMLKVKAANGVCIAQKPSTAEVEYMPAQAIDRKACHLVATPEDMVFFLNN